MLNNCPDEELLVDYIEQRLSPEDRDTLESHFASCDTCLELLAMTRKVMQAEKQGQAAPVPDTVTQSAVSLVTRNLKDSHSPFNLRVKRSLKHAAGHVLDSLRLNGLNQWQFAPVRGEKTAVSENMVCLDVSFGPVDTEVEIEKTLQETAHIRIRLLNPRKSDQVIRVTLKKEKREIASYLLDDYVLFENIPFDRYAISMMKDGMDLGTYFFEIKETRNRR